MTLFASTNLICKYEVLGNVFLNFFSQNKIFLSPFCGNGRETGGRWLGTHKLKQGW